MWAALADLLISEGSSEHLRQDGIVAEHLETLVQTVHQAVEELKGIVLFSQVHSLTPQSEREGRREGGKEGGSGEEGREGGRDGGEGT